MKKPSALKDIVIVLTGFALIGCISFFAMGRVKLAADVWFIPVNRPATEDVALYCSLAGRTVSAYFPQVNVVERVIEVPVQGNVE
jgi:hypothetical protein